MNIDILKTLGNEWQAGDKHRIYINDLMDLYGLKVEYYNSGNISAAWLDGEKISNSQARTMIDKIASITIWYDFVDNDLHVRYRNEKYPKTAGVIVSKIREIAAN